MNGCLSTFTRPASFLPEWVPVLLFYQPASLFLSASMPFHLSLGRTCAHKLPFSHLSACPPTWRHGMPVDWPALLTACQPLSHPYLPYWCPLSLVYLTASLSACQPACMHACQSAGTLPACQPASLPACQPACLPANQPACLPANQPACLPVGRYWCPCAKITPSPSRCWGDFPSHWMQLLHVGIPTNIYIHDKCFSSE